MLLNKNGGSKSNNRNQQIRGWRAENYIKNIATRTGNQFKERTNSSSRETELKKMIKKRPTKQE